MNAHGDDRAGLVPLLVVLLVATSAGMGFVLGRDAGREEAARVEPGPFEPTTVLSAAPSASPAPSVSFSMAQSPSQSPTAVRSGSTAIGSPVRPVTVQCASRATHDVVVEQSKADGTGGMSIGWYSADDGSPSGQLAAQTFTPPASGLRLTELAPTFTYAVGQGATLDLYEVSDARDPISGRLLMTTKLDALAIPSHSPDRIAVEPPIPVECGHLYAIVIRPARDSELGVEATAFGQTGNIYLDGAMFLGPSDKLVATGGDMRFSVSFGRATG